MSRDSKRKLAIVAGISECLVYAEAKYCAFEIHGEPKYYVCPRTEYCCNFGCCVSPGFQIYHLWYYWLLVIIMFLVCSGGGWWYRYWLQGRYRAAASAIPNRGTGSSRGQSSHRGTACPAQQASITYNSARNTVLLHRMWKAGPHRGAGSSPAYTGPPLAAAASSTHFQNTSVVLNDVNCPYYQLYGPPPSYETVIAQTRGKLSSPMSPERTRNLDVSPATGSSILQNQELLPRCYNHSSYNSHPSQAGSIAGLDSTASRYEHSSNAVEPIGQIDSVEASATFTRYAPPYTSSSSGTTPVHPAGRQDLCLPLDYRGNSLISAGAVTAPLDDGQVRIVPETFRIYRGNNLERLPSYHGERTFVDGRTIDDSIVSENRELVEQSRALKINSGDSHSSVPDLKIDGRLPRMPQEEQRYSRHHGGSLKFYRAREDLHEGPAGNYGSFRRGQTFFELSASTCQNEDADTAFDSTRVPCGEASDSEFIAGNDDFMDSGAGFSTSSRNGLLAGDSCRSSVRHYLQQQQQQQQQQERQPQTNPSDNVILEPLTSVKNYDPENATVSHVDDTSASWRTRRNDNDEKKRRRVPSPGARVINNDDSANIVDNHESKHNKLDRSKSLD